MKLKQHLPIVTAAMIVFCCHASAEPVPFPSPSPIAPVHMVYPDNTADLPAATDPAGSELSEKGRNIRGLYIPYPRLRSWNTKRLVRWVREIGADAVVLDIKDDRGRITFTRKLPYIMGYSHGEVRRMGKIVKALRKEDIYVIGRLVCFKDNHLVRVRPDTAIRDRRTGKPWRDHGGLAWVDPHSEVAHEHIVNVAKAAAAIGFQEIQLDYIRFPVENSAKYADYPNRVGSPERYEAIAKVLSKVDQAIDIALSIDVFGLTAYHPGDEDGLGQSLEHLAPYIDAISPMVYLANWPRRYWEYPKPSKTHALVSGAVRRIRLRLGDDIAVRPLLQAFKWRAKNFSRYFIVNQIDAATTGGSSGYLFWNQSGNYHKVAAVWKREKKGAGEE
jgi:hypothetical protein